MDDKRTGNGGHSTKPKREDDKRLLTKADEQKANYLFIQALRELYKVDSDDEAKTKFIKEDLLSSQRGQLFVAEHIFGKAPQEVKNTNVNIDAKDLSEAEIIKIKNVLDATY